MKDDLSSEQILSLLAFFEIWEYPLSEDEVIEWFQHSHISREFLRKSFPHTERKGKIWYSLTRKWETLLRRREEAEALSEKLLRKAKQYTNLLRHFPFIRAVAVVNTVAFQCPYDASDIDLFIVVKKGRVATARFFSTILFMLSGLRASKEKTKGRFCLSFFVDESQQDLSRFLRKEDIYLPYWIAFMKWIWGKETAGSIILTNSPLVLDKTGLAMGGMEKGDLLSLQKEGSMLQRAGEFLIPSFLEGLFQRILRRKARNVLNPSSPTYSPDVVLTSEVHKLHNPDKRDEILDKWKAIRDGFLRGRESGKEEIRQTSCSRSTADRSREWSKSTSILRHQRGS